MGLINPLAIRKQTRRPLWIVHLVILVGEKFSPFQGGLRLLEGRTMAQRKNSALKPATLTLDQWIQSMPAPDEDGCYSIPVELRFPATFVGALAMLSRVRGLPIGEALADMIVEGFPGLIDEINEVGTSEPA
jgi:hypothetical protein